MSRSASCIFTLLTVVSLYSTSARAAPCCGGGSLAPQIVASDFRGQLNSTLSLQALTLSSAWSIPRILDDRIQLSGQLPLPYSLHPDARGMSVGDVSAGLNVEILRNWESSEWVSATDLLAFVGMQLPTGNSIYQVGRSAAQVSGSGFYRLSAGLYLARVFGDFDVQLLLAGHRNFARSFVDGSGDSVFVDPGFGATGIIGVGVSPGSGQIRLGIQAMPLWEQGAVTVQPGQSGRGRDGLSVDLGASVAWLADPTWTLALTYTEPFGTLARERNLAFMVQKRWWR